MIHVPRLSVKTHSLASLSICLRAAQMILSIYFEIFSPAIRIIATTSLSGGQQGPWDQARRLTQLPASWRQVRRITTSMFIVVHAFRKGEATEDEANRASATASVLLDFQRGLRWGNKLQDVVHAIQAVMNANNINVRPYLRLLLPDATEEYLERLICQQEFQEHLQNEGRAQNYSSRSVEPQDISFANSATQIPAEYNDFDIFPDLLPSYADLSSYDFFNFESPQF